MTKVDLGVSATVSHKVILFIIAILVSILACSGCQMFLYVRNSWLFIGVPWPCLLKNLFSLRCLPFSLHADLEICLSAGICQVPFSRRWFHLPSHQQCTKVLSLPFLSQTEYVDKPVDFCQSNQWKMNTCLLLWVTLSICSYVLGHFHLLFCILPVYIACLFWGQGGCWLFSFRFFKEPCMWHIIIPL